MKTTPPPSPCNTKIINPLSHDQTRLSFTMADLPALLLASLNPDTRKQAEQNLTVLSTHQGFLTHLLNLILEPSQDRAVRLSGSVYLKNITKLRWEEVNPTPCYSS